MEFSLEKLGMQGDTAASVRRAHPHAARHHPGHRPDRLRQDDDAVQRAARHQERRHQDHHHRGPGRVPARRDQPDPGAPEDRPDVRRVAARRSCGTTPTWCWSAKSAITKRPRTPSRRRSPATWCSARCTPTTPPSAYTRLVDMGVEPFLVASTIEAVMAQRLVRTLCQKCRAAVRADARRPAERFSVGRVPSRRRAAVSATAAAGSAASSGFAGRQGIFELCADDRRGAATGPRPRQQLGNPQSRPRRRHAHAAPGRVAEGARGHDDGGRSAARDQGRSVVDCGCSMLDCEIAERIESAFRQSSIRTSAI